MLYRLVMASLNKYTDFGVNTLVVFRLDEWLRSLSL